MPCLVSFQISHSSVAFRVLALWIVTEEGRTLRLWLLFSQLALLRLQEAAILDGGKTKDYVL